MTGNIDAAALTYALSEVPLKAGFKSLADAAELKAPYQGPGICALKESIASRPDFYLRLTRGQAEELRSMAEQRKKVSLGSDFYVLTFFGPFLVSQIARSTRD
jgi:hypothetical protein